MLNGNRAGRWRQGRGKAVEGEEKTLYVGWVGGRWAGGAGETQSTNKKMNASVVGRVAHCGSSGSPCFWKYYAAPRSAN